MREIKCRVWDKLLHKWLDPDKCLYTASGKPVSVLSGEIHILDNALVENYVRVEYTGLKDKNGKEICEGDVIQTDYNEVYDFARYAVVWSNELAAWFTACLALHHGQTGYKDVSRGGYCVGYLSSYLNTEVIGNIYENADLLLKEQQHG